MKIIETQKRVQHAMNLAVATVKYILANGDIVVDLRDESTTSLECSILAPIGFVAAAPLVGCSVLVWIDAAAERGVIIGALGVQEVCEVPTDLSDELLIEARKSITLRVGDGSITIRADGKILIKGKELVSHAKNVNRVKGGAVAIN